MQQVKLDYHTFLLLFGIMVWWYLPTSAQVNLSGKSGLMYTPTAVMTDDGFFRIGYNYNPTNYSLKGKNLNPESIWFANVTVLPRLEITVTLLRMIDTPLRYISESQGIGDRSMDVRYQILKENQKRPGLAVIMTVPFTIDAGMLTQVLVATKKFELSSHWNLGVTVGYGSPYFVYRKKSITNNYSFLSNFVLQKKSAYHYWNHYLVGPFGGLSLSFRQKAGLMAEYDSQHLNVGAYATFFKKWTVQAGWLNGDQFMFGTSFGVNLLKLPRKVK